MPTVARGPEVYELGLPGLPAPLLPLQLLLQWEHFRPRLALLPLGHVHGGCVSSAHILEL